MVKFVNISISRAAILKFQNQQKAPNLSNITNKKKRKKIGEKSSWRAFKWKVEYWPCSKMLAWNRNGPLELSPIKLIKLLMLWSGIWWEFFEKLAPEKKNLRRAKNCIARETKIRLAFLVFAFFNTHNVFSFFFQRAFLRIFMYTKNFLRRQREFFYWSRKREKNFLGETRLSGVVKYAVQNTHNFPSSQGNNAVNFSLTS